MKRKCFLFFFIISLIFISFSFGNDVNAYSYLSDKTEIPINLEVSGAETVCQTDDGYVWFGQYSGLVRYDSNEFITYTTFIPNIYNNTSKHQKATNCHMHKLQKCN